MRKAMRHTGIFLALCMAVCLLSACGDGQKIQGGEDKIVVFNYGDYMAPGVTKQFQEETGIEVVYEEFLMPEAMYTKYRTGAADYDLICCSDYMLEKLIDENEALEIDYASMPNYKNIGEFYRRMSEYFDEGNKYTVPYFFGTVGILYNTKMVDGEPDSWDILWDETYNNKIIMQNSVRDTFIPALVKLGYSINTTDKGQLQEAKELIIRQKPLVQSYLVDEIRDDMANGEAAIGLVYSGEAAVAMDYNEDLAYTVPKEGTDMWMDSWIIPKTSKNKEGAEQFLDFLCREDIARKNFEYVYYSTPNQAVYDSLDEETKEDACIFPSDEVLEKCEVFKYLGNDMEKYYNELWKEIKAH